MKDRQKDGRMKTGRKRRTNKRRTKMKRKIRKRRKRRILGLWSYKWAIKLSPKLVDAYYNLGNLLLGSNQVEKAIERLEVAGESPSTSYLNP